MRGAAERSGYGVPDQRKKQENEIEIMPHGPAWDHAESLIFLEVHTLH
jgi:hypothetical protein